MTNQMTATAHPLRFPYQFWFGWIQFCTRFHYFKHTKRVSAQLFEYWCIAIEYKIHFWKCIRMAFLVFVSHQLRTILAQSIFFSWAHTHDWAVIFYVNFSLQLYRIFHTRTLIEACVIFVQFWNELKITQWNDDRFSNRKLHIAIEITP